MFQSGCHDRRKTVLRCIEVLEYGTNHRSAELFRYQHRGHSISISITRSDNKVIVELEIVLPTTPEEKARHASHPAIAQAVSTLALEDIHKEAFESAKRTVDVLIAERSAANRPQ